MASVIPKARSRQAERRHQLARESLQKASDLAAILCSDALDAVPSLRMEDSDECSSYRYSAPPKTHVEDLKDILKRVVKTSMDTSTSTTECSFLHPPFHTYWIPKHCLEPDSQDHPSDDEEADAAAHSHYPLLIHWAAKLGNIPVFECLVQLDPLCVFVGNASGQTALHIAIEAGKTNWVRVCCTKFPSTCWRMDHLGNLPLHHAAANARKNVWVATPPLAQYPKAIWLPNQAGLYPIHLACVRAWNQGIKVLLAVASSLVHQRCNKEQWLPIDWTLYVHQKLKNELLNRGTSTSSSTSSISSSSPSPWIPDFSKCTEQELLSLQLDYDECLELLLLTSYKGRAVFSRDSEEETFLPAHALLKQPVTHWNYALQSSCCYGKKRYVESVDHLGRSPLHVLLEEGECYTTEDQVAIIRALHQLAPEGLFSQVDAKGRIPLQIAILEDAPKEIVQVLVECGGPATAGIKWKAALTSLVSLRDTEP
jgi:hypothetical protein